MHSGRKISADLPWKSGAQLTDSQGGWETIAQSTLPTATQLPPTTSAAFYGSKNCAPIIPATGSEDFLINMIGFWVEIWISVGFRVDLN